MSVIDELGLMVTDVTEDDMPLVWSSWLRCSHDSEAGRSVRKSQFIADQKRRIESVLADPDTQLLVLRSAEFPIVVDGWVCTTGDHLNFQYLKSSRRKLGLGSELLRLAGPLSTYGFVRRPWSDMYERRGLTLKAGNE